MRSTARITVGLMLFILAAFAGGLSPADAGSCAAPTGGIGVNACTFELTQSNITELNGAVDVRVIWTNTNTSGTTLSVQWISGGPGTPKNISEFGFNSNVGITAITGGGLFADWTVKHSGDTGCTGGCNINSFGRFATDAQRNDGTFGILAPIVFTLASQITNIPDNSNAAEFVVHIAWGSTPPAPDCSGFVSDGASNGTNSSPNCASVPSVPEPGTMALFGTGLVGVGAMTGRRLFSRGGRKVV